MSFDTCRRIIEDMITAIGIGVIAIVLAVVVVVTAGRRRQAEVGTHTTWSGVRRAFGADVLSGLREESAALGEREAQDTDVRVGEMLTDLAEDGSGYLQPRDLLAPRPSRD